MQRIVRTERDEPMRYWDPDMCFVRNENGNMIPGEKGLCRNMVTHSFQNMKNKFTLKKKKKNGSDRFILSYLEVSPLSLCIKDQQEQARPHRQEDSLHTRCYWVGPLLTGPWFLTQMWLSGLSQKWKKSASSRNVNRLHTQWVSLSRPTFTTNLNVGTFDCISNPEGTKYPSVAH